MSEDKTTTTSANTDYGSFWGKDAEPGQVKITPRGTITVPDRFLRGPLLNIIERKQGSAAPEAMRTFCEDALMDWYKKYKDRRAAAGPERRAEVRALVPTPAKGEAMSRIDVNLEGRIKEDAFGRVLDIRFKASPEGRSMAIREAILEALVAGRSTEV